MSDVLYHHQMPFNIDTIDGVTIVNHGGGSFYASFVFEVKNKCFDNGWWVFTKNIGYKVRVESKEAGIEKAKAFIVNGIFDDYKIYQEPESTHLFSEVVSEVESDLYISYMKKPKGAKRRFPERLDDWFWV